MDNLTKKQRHLCMSRIRSKNTKPELAVRRMLRRLKIRHSLHSKKLPGKADIVITKKRMVIFINGCFWHQHKGCTRQAMPKVNVKYWRKKLERNVKRQKSVLIKLRKEKWKPLIIWECQIKRPDQLNQIIKKHYYEKGNF